MSPFANLAQGSSALSYESDSKRADSASTPLANAGSLLVDLADQVLALAVFITDDDGAQSLSDRLCRQAERTRYIAHKLARSSESALDGVTLLNEAILALDEVGIELESASEVAREVRIKNQIARARIAVTTAGAAVDHAQNTLAVEP